MNCSSTTTPLFIRWIVIANAIAIVFDWCYTSIAVAPGCVVVVGDLVAFWVVSSGACNSVVGGSTVCGCPRCTVVLSGNSSGVRFCNFVDDSPHDEAYTQSQYSPDNVAGPVNHGSTTQTWYCATCDSRDPNLGMSQIATSSMSRPPQESDHGEFGLSVRSAT